MNNSVMLIGNITSIVNGIMEIRVNDSFNIGCDIENVACRLSDAKAGDRIAVEGRLAPKEGTFIVSVNDIFVIG